MRCPHPQWPTIRHEQQLAACAPHCRFHDPHASALDPGLDGKAPWFQIKEDPQAAVTTVYVILRVADNLRTILVPILLHTAQKLHEFLGYDGQPFGSASLGLGRDRQGRLFGTQYVIEYAEETLSYRALTHDHSGAIGDTFAALSAGLGEE
jgi:hypothetical protein